jgi:lambda repressor-like predicted transcriptional regulator
VRGYEAKVARLSVRSSMYIYVPAAGNKYPKMQALIAIAIGVEVGSFSPVASTIE